MDKLVRIRDSTYNELAKCGKWNDTMDSIIQGLLQQQQNNQGIGDTPKKPEREERPHQESNLQDSAREDMLKPFANGDGSIRNCHSTSRANIPNAIAECRTRRYSEAADDEKVVKEKRNREKMMIMEGNEGKNMLQDALQVGSQKRQAEISSSQPAEWDGEDTRYE